MSDYMPTLSVLLPVENIPNSLGVFQNGINNIFSHLYYSDFKIDRSASGDEVYYSLTIISYKRLAIELPGTTEMALVLNPGFHSGSSTDFPIGIGYRWGILKYINNFKLSDFDFTTRAFYDLLLSITGASNTSVLQKIIDVFYAGEDEEDPIQQFISHFNLIFTPPTPLIKSSSSNEIDIIEDILSQLISNGNNFDFIDFVFNVYFNLDDELGNASYKIEKIFSELLGNFTIENIKNILIPQFSASLTNLRIAIEFPRSVLQPLKSNGTIDPDLSVKSSLNFDIGSIIFSSNSGFDFLNETNFNFTKSAILNSGFTLEIENMKLDLSRTKNFPEAIADGRPSDFIGVYIKNGIVGFPDEWNHQSSPSDSTGELYVNNLLVGTGGLSGTIGLRGIVVTQASGSTPATRHSSPLIKLKLGGKYEISLDAFDITFQQNAILESNIHGTLKIKGFKDAANKTQDAVINIDIHIGTDGEFKIVASTKQSLTALHLENVFDFHISSLFIGRQSVAAGGNYYIGLSGDIDFLVQPPLGKFLPDKVEIKKLLIYDDGSYEFEGGTIVLPKAFELKMGPAKIGVTAIHLGSYEKEGRKYKYFGFDGGVNVNPGGVDAKGKGIKFYYTVDGGSFLWFIRMDSLSIDIYIPGGGTKESAAVIIKGYLSIKEPKIDTASIDSTAVSKNATEYAGGVYISIPKFKGLEASASMRLTPAVPAFIIDLGIEISTPILLGTTGLGIYGFRAIFGKRYVATKRAADIPDDGEWWQYYKAKIDPDYKEGIQLSKFSIKEGFSIGAGVSLATSSDSGKTFSSKLFFLLSLPDVFLFQGQAQFLKERISLDAVPDPPFFAIIAITKRSVECGFGINYKIPEDTGKLVTMDGVTELGFFFGDAAAWYFNIGRESPDSMRIQARVFDILNMYFYFMISNSGIRAGAGVSIELKKSFGPLSAELSAYMDTKGRISFRPKQIGGAIQLGGTVSLKCCGFGFSVVGSATLAAEAPKPHIVSGEFEVCVKVLKKERCAHFEFTWNFNQNLNQSRNGVLVDVIEGIDTSNEMDISKVAKATHIVTGETLNLASTVLYDGDPTQTAPNSNNIPDPSTSSAWMNSIAPNNIIIPLDSFIDIEFKKGLNVIPSTGAGNNLHKIGGISTPCEYIEYVPPQRGKSPRVRHEYYLDKIEIKYWDNGWKDYDFYEALMPMFPASSLGGLIDPIALQNMKWGYWQQQRPGYNNKLRILATTPLSYAAKTDSLPIENLGINASTILCPGAKIPRTCVTFDRETLYQTFRSKALHARKGMVFKITNDDGIVLDIPYLDENQGLVIQPGNTIEIFFKEAMKRVKLLINSGGPSIKAEYYEHVAVLKSNGDPELNGGLPQFRYDLIEEVTYTKQTWTTEITYFNLAKNVDYIKLTTVSCYESPRDPRNIICLNQNEQNFHRTEELKNFITTLVTNKHFTAPAIQLNPENSSIYKDVYLNTNLYPGKDVNIIQLVQGYISGTTLLFTISDDAGFNCHYSFELLHPRLGFSFSNINSVISVTPYTSGAITGANYYFLLTVKAEIDGREEEIEIIGKSCIPIAYCYDECSTILYRVCYLSHAKYLLNQTVPSTSEQQANNAALLDGINKTLQPIWRPNTTYAIRIKTSDKLYRDGSQTLLREYKLDVAYGFKTAGPVGHYHKYPTSNTPETQILRSDFEALDLADKSDDFKLLNLKYYIDFEKCYPNADGDIINAKPLFYLNAELRLFYLYNHVYEFYSDWKITDPQTNATTDIAKSSLQVVVRDPVEFSPPEINASLSFVGNSISHVDAQNPMMPPTNLNNINNDVSTLNNILLNPSAMGIGTPCTPFPIYQPLAPIDISTKKILDLKPLKLYTAQFIAKYNPYINNSHASPDYESVVHSYSFQTSQYRSFEEQVESYILKKDTAGLILKEAVFILAAGPQLNLTHGQNVITNNEMSLPDALKLQYADRFDRLINGVLQIDYSILHAAVTTEFNIITHPATNHIIGLLIRNPEPFNDPKLPIANPNLSSTEPTETLEVRKWNGSTWLPPDKYYVIHSKDRSRIFVTKSNFDFNLDPMSKLKFTFRYKLFNGISYADVSVVDVEINLGSYPIL